MRKIIILFALIVCCGCVLGEQVKEFHPAEEVNAADYGVKADGVTPCGDALQKAMDAINKDGAQGGTVRLPAGQILMDKPVTVPNRTVLEGAGASWENTATTFVIKHRTGPAFTLLTHCGIKGVCFYYPDNLTDEKMEKPDEYPPSVEILGCNNTLEYVSVDGAWTFCSVPKGGTNAGQCYFGNINGFCHYRGFYLTGAADINRFENIHFFPSQSTRTYGTFSANNLIAFEFGRQDGAMFNSCFIIRGKGFFRQTEENGIDGKWSHSLGYSFMNCWIENVDVAFDFAGVCGFTIAGSNILVKEKGTGIKISAECLAYNAIVNSTQIRGYGGKDFTGIDFDMKYRWWAPNGLNKLTVNDCQIQRAKPAIRLGNNAHRVWIQGCLLSGYPAIDIAKEACGYNISDNIFQLEDKDMSKINNRSAVRKDNIIKNNITDNLIPKEPER